MTRYLEKCGKQWRPKQGKSEWQKQKGEKKKKQKKGKTMQINKVVEEQEIWDKKKRQQDQRKK